MDMNVMQSKNGKCHISECNRKCSKKEHNKYDIKMIYVLATTNKGELESKSNYVLNRIRMADMTINKSSGVSTCEKNILDTKLQIMVFHQTQI